MWRSVSLLIVLVVALPWPHADALAVPRPDTSALVEQALKTTAAFGIHSPEARIAWETVEEMDASDNSEASKGSLDQECLVTDDTTPTPDACLEYATFLDQLRRVRDAMAAAAQTRRRVSLVQALQAIRLQPPEAQRVESRPELTKALENAKQATSQYGVASVEAKLAWEAYEEIASAGYQNAVGVVSLLEECAVDTGTEACRAMEELERVMPVLLSLDLTNDSGP